MMRPPPFLLFAALLFWGWHSDLVAVGFIAGGLLELSHGLKVRWDFSDREFNRLWDVCTILFLAGAVYLRFSEEVTSAAYKFFQWMPLVFFPMALGTAFSLREGVPVKAFSWFLRRKGASGGDRPVAFGWVYFAVCIITAGATNSRGDIWYYVGFAVLTGWALWAVRPRRVPFAAWAALFAVVAGLAFYGQLRLPDLQGYLEMKASELFVRFGRRDFDPTQTRTAMGQIGALKQSGIIVMKVKSDGGPVPERLREASYLQLHGAVWRGGIRGFEQVAVEPDLTTWRLKTNGEIKSSVQIVERVNRKSSFLAVPMGTLRFENLPVGSVETNGFGAVRVNENPGLLSFSALYGRQPIDRPPIDPDLDIPPKELSAIEQVASEMQLEGLSDRKKIERIISFFQEKFRYTTFQQAQKLGLHSRTPLTDFLLNTRAGHCEYFATATVFLLRHYHIPARYAIGYAVQEYSQEEQCYIVRERHGHAWAQAFLDGNWTEVDSTPPGWDQMEQEEFPFYQDWKDGWERFRFSFLEWRWLGRWGVLRLIAPWLAAPLIAFLAWRIFGRRMARSHSGPRQARRWPGADSEFFQLESRLARMGLGRGNHETTAEWLRRISEEHPVSLELIQRAAGIHQKYRFSPDGITEAERTELKTLVRHCLDEAESWVREQGKGGLERESLRRVM